MSHAQVRTPVGRSASFAVVAGVYIAALVVAAVVLRIAPAPGGLKAAFAADFAATLVVFAASVSARNASMYDAYWSVAPLALVTVWALQGGASDVPPARVALVVGAVWWWGARLTWNWARGWGGLHEEDWRYAMLREKTGVFYPAVNFGGIHLFPTIQVFAGLVPAWFALRSSGAVGLLDAVAGVVLVGAIVVETVADRQLADFIASAPAPGSVIDTGLWRFSRHPNYFGEVGFWWGLAVVGLGAGGPVWSVAGAVAITAMFVGISIPMMERRQLARRPEFARTMRTTSMLVPLPRRR